MADQEGHRRPPRPAAFGWPWRAHATSRTLVAAAHAIRKAYTELQPASLAQTRATRAVPRRDAHGLGADPPAKSCPKRRRDERAGVSVVNSLRVRSLSLACLPRHRTLLHRRRAGSPRCSRKGTTRRSKTVLRPPDGDAMPSEVDLLSPTPRLTKELQHNIPPGLPPAPARGADDTPETPQGAAVHVQSDPHSGAPLHGRAALVVRH